MLAAPCCAFLGLESPAPLPSLGAKQAWEGAKKALSQGMGEPPALSRKDLDDLRDLAWRLAVESIAREGAGLARSAGPRLARLSAGRFEAVVELGVDGAVWTTQTKRWGASREEGVDAFERACAQAENHKAPWARRVEAMSQALGIDAQEVDAWRRRRHARQIQEQAREDQAEQEQAGQEQAGQEQAEEGQAEGERRPRGPAPSSARWDDAMEAIGQGLWQAQGEQYEMAMALGAARELGRLLGTSRLGEEARAKLLLSACAPSGQASLGAKPWREGKVGAQDPAGTALALAMWSALAPRRQNQEKNQSNQSNQSNPQGDRSQVGAKKTPKESPSEGSSPPNNASKSASSEDGSWREKEKEKAVPSEAWAWGDDAPGQVKAALRDQFGLGQAGWKMLVGLARERADFAPSLASNLRGLRAWEQAIPMPPALRPSWRRRECRWENSGSQTAWRWLWREGSAENAALALLCALANLGAKNHWSMLDVLRLGAPQWLAQQGERPREHFAQNAFAMGPACWRRMALMIQEEIQAPWWRKLGDRLGRAPYRAIDRNLTQAWKNVVEKTLGQTAKGQTPSGKINTMPIAAMDPSLWALALKTKAPKGLPMEAEGERASRLAAQQAPHGQAACDGRERGPDGEAAAGHGEPNHGEIERGTWEAALAWGHAQRQAWAGEGGLWALSVWMELAMRKGPDQAQRETLDWRVWMHFFPTQPDDVEGEPGLWTSCQNSAKEGARPAWAGAARLATQALARQELKTQKVTWSPAVGSDPIDCGEGFWARELCDGASLTLEGKSQKHCVGGYANRCATGASHIFALEGPQNQRSTLEASPGLGKKKKWRERQHTRKGNHAVNSAQRSAARQLLQILQQASDSKNQ